MMRAFLRKDSSNEYLKGFLIFNKENPQFISLACKDLFFKQIFPVINGEDLFEKYVEESLSKGDKARKEILAFLKRYRQAGSTSLGYYYIKPDKPNPSNLDIIEGLQF